MRFGHLRNSLQRHAPMIGVAALALAVLFAIYIWNLYGQLDQSFAKQDEFVPTRIYSDVTRISPPQSRGVIEGRLTNLGYTATRVESDLKFSLHPIDYPSYLLPDGHAQIDAKDRAVTLQFDGTDKDAALHSIHLGQVEITDLYLEPELVATLSRGTKEIREIIKFDDIPAPIWKAIISIEDQHFLEHSGFDPRGLARAIWVNLRTRSLAQGGSTITQQLVKNLMARRTKNVFRKVNELFLALLLEARYSKQQILERYLNEVYLGQVGSLEVHGVSEGAKHFFGKRLEEMNLAEIALMAGLIRGPGYYSPYRFRERAMERQKLVLKKMVEVGNIAEAEAKAALKQPIRLAPPQTTANKAPYFTDFVKAELIRHLKDKMSEQEITAAGFRVYTTLDMHMNVLAQKAVGQGIDELEKRLKIPATDRLEGALAAVDHTTGFIRALIGGRSYAQSTFNRILNMKRQVGSTFKPVVYLSAFDKGKDLQGVPYGPGHPIEDAPWTLIYDHGRQKWSPKNYEKENLGWISFRTALAHSVNTAAAKLGVEVGVHKIIEIARALGIESELPEVPSLSLGVAELSPVELVKAYATIANHGVQEEVTVILGITKDNGDGYARFVYHPKNAVAAGPVDLLTDMMQNVFTEGTARDAIKMGFDRPAAGKTGTTSNHRDSWFAGFTPQLTCVVWVGADQDHAKEGTKPVTLTGAGSALPIWSRFMKEALEGEPPLGFNESTNLVSVKIDRHTGKLASSGCPDSQTQVDKYVVGNEPRDTSCESLYPATQTETQAEF